MSAAVEPLVVGGAVVEPLVVGGAVLPNAHLTMMKTVAIAGFLSDQNKFANSI